MRTNYGSNSNKLKLNPSNTEFMVSSSVAMQKRLEPLLPSQILGERFKAAESVWNLGFILDCDFSFKKQVDTVIRSCFCGLRDLQKI